MDGLDALPSPLPRPDPYSFPDLISSSTASSSLHESRGPPVPSCLAGVSTIHSRRSTLGPEAGHARVCRSQPLFMHLISLHRLRGLAASQSFLRTASLVRKEGSQLRLRDDPEPRLCGPCDPATLEGSTPFAASPSDIDGLFWLTSREPQLPASDLLDPRRRRTPKHDAIWPPELLRAIRPSAGNRPVTWLMTHERRWKLGIAGSCLVAHGIADGVGHSLSSLEFLRRPAPSSAPSTPSS